MEAPLYEIGQTVIYTIYTGGGGCEKYCAEILDAFYYDQVGLPTGWVYRIMHLGSDCWIPEPNLEVLN